MNNIQKAEIAMKTAKGQYLYGQISYEQMRDIAQEYVDLANEKGKEIAKRFNIKPRKISVSAVLR